MLALISSHCNSHSAFTPASGSGFTVSYSGSFDTGTYNGKTYYVFKTGSATALTITGSGTINYFMVGGGGGGGSGALGPGTTYVFGGNGGNGGQIISGTISVSDSFSTNVTIGSGASSKTNSTASTDGAYGGQGNSTLFNGLTATGGIGGYGGVRSSLSNGQSLQPQPTFNSTNYGKGGTGVDAATAQNGADGYTCPGNGVKYGAGGGGGTRRLNGTKSTGGNYGGGQGSANNDTNNIQLPGSGLANSGSGGGGGLGVNSTSSLATYQPYVNSGAGGSGAVVIWW